VCCPIPRTCGVGRFFRGDRPGSWVVMPLSVLLLWREQPRVHVPAGPSIRPWNWDLGILPQAVDEKPVRAGNRPQKARKERVYPGLSSRSAAQRPTLVSDDELGRAGSFASRMGRQAPTGPPIRRSDGFARSDVFRDDTIRLWNVRTHRQLGKPLVDDREPVESVVLSANSRLLASGSDERTVRVWDVRTHKHSASLSAGTPARSGASRSVRTAASSLRAAPTTRSGLWSIARITGSSSASG